jgi:hypothetical protein
MSFSRRDAILGAAAMSGIAVAATLAEAQAPPPHPGHPRIRSAIRALEQAKEELQHAPHDFGGHRVDAIRASDEAIRQLQICLRYP